MGRPKGYRTAQTVHAQALDLINSLFGDLEAGFGASQQFLSMLEPTIEKGFDAATAAVRGSERGSQQAIREQTARSLGAVGQGAVSAGLYDSTARLQRETQVLSQQNMLFNQLYGDLAQVYANIELGRTQALTGAIGAQAALPLQKFEALSALKANQANLLLKNPRAQLFMSGGGDPGGGVGGALTGAVSGASAGAAFGPWGAAIGGVVGGVGGYL